MSQKWGTGLEKLAGREDRRWCSKSWAQLLTLVIIHTSTKRNNKEDLLEKCNLRMVVRVDVSYHYVKLQFIHSVTQLL